MTDREIRNRAEWLALSEAELDAIRAEADLDVHRVRRQLNLPRTLLDVAYEAMLEQTERIDS
ncbi:MAG: hypothetical protein DMD33_17910 [Gemmatimonadetes bacterium]|nr:MAG: hypothetical protein DMD33_17910 [Gemmatimonadota bacterium]